MDTIAIALAWILFFIALVHLLWAFGLVWPARDAKSLSDAVVGAKHAKGMPGRWLTLCVALLIAAAGYLPLMWQGLAPYPHAFPQSLVWLGMWGLTLVFAGRGVVSYLPVAWEPVQPFHRLNRLIYSPLCLLLAAGFFILVTAPL